MGEGYLGNNKGVKAGNGNKIFPNPVCPSAHVRLPLYIFGAFYPKTLLDAHKKEPNYLLSSLGLIGFST